MFCCPLTCPRGSFPLHLFSFYFFNRPRCPLERVQNVLLPSDLSALQFSPFPYSLFVLSIVLAVHWSGKKMSCCLLTCLRCSFPSSPFLFLFCQSSSLSNGAGQKIFCYLLTCPRCSFSFPLFPFPFLFFQSSLLSNGAGRKIFC